MKFDKDPNDGSGAANLLKLKGGESIVGVFRGEPYPFYSKWVGKKSYVCRETDMDAKFRFKINFVTKMPDLSYVAKVWEQGAKTYKLLKAIHQDFPLEKTIVKITRHGTDTNTNYTIMPIPQNQVTPQLEEVLKNVDLNDLSKNMQPVETGQINENQAFPPETFNQTDELPF